MSSVTLVEEKLALKCSKIICSLLWKIFHLSLSFFFFLLAFAFESPHMFVPPWVDGMFSIAIPCNQKYFVQCVHRVGIIKLFRKFSIKLKTLMNVETWREGPSLSCRVIPSHWRTTSSDKNHENVKVTSKRTSWHFRQRTKHVFLWFCFPLFASLSNGKRSWIFRFSEGSSRKSILFLLTMICRFSWRFRQLFEKVSLVAYSKYLTMIFFIT